jgi:hypothetical protein
MMKPRFFLSFSALLLVERSTFAFRSSNGNVLRIYPKNVIFPKIKNTILRVAMPFEDDPTPSSIDPKKY